MRIEELKIEIDLILVIDTPWIDMFFLKENPKIWEMRSTKTKKRGLIGLVKKGSGKIIGVANLIDSPPKMTQEELIKNKEKHKINFSDQKFLKWSFPWIFDDVVKLKNPVKYEHKQGAVIWCKV